MGRALPGHPPSVGAPPLALITTALVVGGFAIGTTEFVTMGLLPQIADGLGVSIPTAGHTISAYAIGVVIGAPTLTALYAQALSKAGRGSKQLDVVEAAF